MSPCFGVVFDVDGNLVKLAPLTFAVAPVATMNEWKLLWRGGKLAVTDHRRAALNRTVKGADTRRLFYAAKILDWRRTIARLGSD